MSQWVKWLSVKVSSSKISNKKIIQDDYLYYQQCSSRDKKMSGYKIPCDAEGL